jgi:GNAT superfamily N-acetyltransferase
MSQALDPLTVFRRSERVLAEQIAQWESLEYGVAFIAPAFTDLPEANQLREVWLADLDAESVFTRTEAYFAAHELTCRMWTPASGQPIEPVEALLRRKDWQRREQVIYQQMNASPVTATIPSDVRVLPARAMPRAYRAAFETNEPLSEMRAHAAMERLNDSNLDAFVATVDGRAAGRISYLSVGDAARIFDVFVLPMHRRRGVGRAMMSYVLQLARRLLPKLLVAAGDPSKLDESTSYWTASGFIPVARAVDFVRP